MDVLLEYRELVWLMVMERRQSPKLLESVG